MKRGLERPAGSKLIEWANTPIGEEVIEGVVGGTMAGIPLFFSDTDPKQAALMTATAIAGGIGVGMAGRRIGAGLGRSVQPQPLKNQQGMVAGLARIGGQETIGEALRETGAHLKGQVADYLVENKATSMLRDGLMSEHEWEKLKRMRQYQAVKTSMLNMPPEAQEMLAQSMGTDLAALKKLIDSDVMPEALRKMPEISDMDRLAELEHILTSEAMTEMDVGLMKAADELRSNAEMKEAVGRMVTPEALTSIARGKTKPITGEHVGRAIGRFAGDEIGILGGLGVGALVAQQMDIQSPKDRKIAELQAQLEGRP